MSRSDVAEIHLSSGTLLIGLRTDPQIVFWQKATGQDRLSLIAGHELHRHEAAAAQLRQLADRVGLFSYRPYMTNAALGEAFRDAIDTRRLSAVFLPNVPPPAPLRVHLTLVRSRGGEQTPRFDFARATRAERMVEMLRRTPPYLRGGVKQAISTLLSSRSVAMLGATLAGVAAAHLVGAGEAVDAALAGFAFVTAGWDGLVALKDIVAATVKVATATRDAQLNEAAWQFAGGLMVLGEAFLAFVMARLVRSRGASNADQESALATRDLTISRRQKTVISGRSNYHDNSDPLGKKLWSKLFQEDSLSNGVRPIAGAGTSTPLRKEPHLIKEYGGQQGDWSKMTGPEKHGRELHWYENIRTGYKVLPKIKIDGKSVEKEE